MKMNYFYNRSEFHEAKVISLMALLHVSKIPAESSFNEIFIRARLIFMWPCVWGKWYWLGYFCRSCCHFTDLGQPSLSDKSRCLADVILGCDNIMTNILQALAGGGGAPHSDTPWLWSNSPDNYLVEMDPIHTTHGLFQIVDSMNKHCTDLGLILKPLYEFLSSRQPG